MLQRHCVVTYVENGRLTSISGRIVLCSDGVLLHVACDRKVEHGTVLPFVGGDVDASGFRPLSADPTPTTLGE